MTLIFNIPTNLSKNVILLDITLNKIYNIIDKYRQTFILLIRSEVIRSEWSV